ncbi:unnamed protein product, partial [Iphiclides podalirius]
MKVLLVHLLIIGAALCSPRLDPLVDTKKGLIRGLQASDGDYAMFLGIPYARVNESNPFGPSHPYPDFEEVFEAYDDTAVCPQIEEFSNEIVGSLDCLHLNIYVPNKATTRNRLPVLVWIYGGGFQIGYAGRFLYGPKYLVRNDVILVTLNYRVGPYGFMCLDTADVPGNQGLKDQLTALRWVKDNIDAFGGDVNKVTIFGESAGGASVDFHLLSTKEKLFDKAILQSGTTLCPWVMEDSDSKNQAPIKIAERLGLDTDSTDDALEFLTTVKPELVIAASSEIPLNFLPCVEKEFEGVERFIAVHPINGAAPKARSVPILAGYNSNEMLEIAGKKPAESYQDSDVFHEYLTHIFDLSEDGELETIVRQFYIGDEDISVDLKRELINFESDLSFNHPVHRSVQKYLANAGRVYHYLFSYSGNRNFVKYMKNITDDGAAHADEIGYLFDMTLLSEDPSEEDQLVIDRMTTMWTNFVKYGDPTPETSDLLPVKWVPATAEKLNYLNIDSDLTLRRRPFHDRMAFLDLFFEMNKNLLRGYDGGNE